MSLVMTKLVVADLEKAKIFYEKLCGFREGRRIEANDGDRRITEIILLSEGSDEPSGLVLLSYHDSDVAITGECTLVFETDDVAAFVDRAVAAGGSILTPVTKVPDFGLTFALVKDPEGHTLEPLHRYEPGRI